MPFMTWQVFLNIIHHTGLCSMFFHVDLFKDKAYIKLLETPQSLLLYCVMWCTLPLFDKASSLRFTNLARSIWTALSLWGRGFLSSKHAQAHIRAPGSFLFLHEGRYLGSMLFPWLA